MPTTAKIIADSISETGQRITTLVLEFPRIVLAEFNTHRMFSRNASSSRAIPVEKQIERIEQDPFIPTYWGKNQKGMQANEEVSPELQVVGINLWKGAGEKMVDSASALMKFGFHKQLANRLLEPFSHIQVVVTATEWGNFFAQRLHPAAQPEIQELARVMKEAMDNSTPKLLHTQDWHLPFVDSSEVYSLGQMYLEDCQHMTEQAQFEWLSDKTLEQRIKVSVARCARVSYGLNERGWGDIEKDLALYDMLLTNNHWSPFEHQATPIQAPISTGYEHKWEDGVTHNDVNFTFWSGNFKAWIQNRQLIQQSC